MTRALNMDLIFCFFDAANIHRWNDHLRPIDLTELDKQAHKAAIAWVLGKFEEQETGRPLRWDAIIEGSMFSFIQRAILTDLKPQLFHKIKKERFDEVNDYVLEEFDRLVPNSDPEFRRNLETYLRSERSGREDDIVRAAHYIATYWEFKLIYDMNKSLFGIDQTKKDLEAELLPHLDLTGVRKVLYESGSTSFIDLFGQLRFQQRWTRIPRIPQTTVLGHSLLVADMIYLHDLDAGSSVRQRYNDFYAALFHDLPEVLTKDVISPVKKNVQGLSEILDDYERQLVQSKIMPLIPKEWHAEFDYLVFDPFTEKDDPVLGRKSGLELKSCDLLGAYIEAYVSRCYGVSSSRLKDGEVALRERLTIDGGNIGAADLMKRLDEMRI